MCLAWVATKGQENIGIFGQAFKPFLAVPVFRVTTVSDATFELVSKGIGVLVPQYVQGMIAAAWGGSWVR
jgi:hypothetical protein